MGEEANAVLLTTNQSGGVLCRLGSSRRRSEEEAKKTRQAREVGGWVDCKADPKGQLFWEGGTVTNTLHLICKAAAKVHLSTASERCYQSTEAINVSFQ